MHEPFEGLPVFIRDRADGWPAEMLNACCHKARRSILPRIRLNVLPHLRHRIDTGHDNAGHGQGWCRERTL